MPRSPIYALHAFKWVDADGGERYVRYTWRPTLRLEPLARGEARRRGRDYLREDLEARLADGPVRFELEVQVAGPGDDPARSRPRSGPMIVTASSSARSTRPLRVRRATSTSSTRPGSPTGSSSRATRSCVSGPAPTRSRTSSGLRTPSTRREPQVRITHIGGPTALIEVGGWRLLTDPTFDPPGRSTIRLGHASRKLAGPAVAAADLARSTRSCSATTTTRTTSTRPAARCCPRGRRHHDRPQAPKRLGGERPRARGLADHAARGAGRPPVEITATPCRHGPPLCRPLVGDVIGFALDWDGQEHGALWISGDTVLYDGVREVADRLESAPRSSISVASASRSRGRSTTR